MGSFADEAAVQALAERLEQDEGQGWEEEEDDEDGDGEHDTTDARLDRNLQILLLLQCDEFVAFRTKMEQLQLGAVVEVAGTKFAGM